MAFNIWKTIKLGTGLKTAADFRNAFETVGCNLGQGGANAIIEGSEFAVAAKEIKVDLVCVTARNLGFKDDTTFSNIYLMAIEKGLAICPVEIGPQLRLQYLNQQDEENSRLYIGMSPIQIKKSQKRWECVKCIFTLYNESNGLWLGTTDINDPNRACSDSQHFIFIRPK